MVVCSSRVLKIKDLLKFCKISSYFVLNMELLFSMLSNFEKKLAHKDSAF